MLLRRYLYLAVALVVGVLLLAQSVKAQSEPDALDVVRQAVDDGSAAGGVDTVIVFTNLRRTPEKARLSAVDEHGQQVGTAEIEIPGNGLSAILVSRLLTASPVRRFVGKAVAKATGRIAGSALLVGGGPVTDLPVIRRVYWPPVTTTPDAGAIRPRPATHLTFPATAAN